MSEAGWEHFHHQADIGVRGWGPTPEAAFAEGALALTAVIVEPDAVASRDPVAVACEATDLELLFADWLNALVFEMATRGMLFSRFDVRIAGDRLAATAWGEPIDRERHRPTVEVKGATYTALRVARESDGRWVAQKIVDV
jgi:tRNA nucleotidyltransferase (CCA-adding enzyme)